VWVWGVIGSWLAMHKHQYLPGYSGRAGYRDRGGVVRCAGGSTVRCSSTPGHGSSSRAVGKEVRRANTEQQWISYRVYQPHGVYQQLPRPQGGQCRLLGACVVCGRI
jgi:hypothetical protein